MPVILDDLAWKQGIDKSTRIHGYTRAYGRVFQHLRLDPIKLLEIGVGSAGSLRMWRDYFPYAEIYGVDNTEVPHPERTTVITGDQSDGIFLSKLIADFKSFDIIIDDGSHISSDQIFTFKTLFPAVATNGFYVIEDLHTSYWPDYTHGLLSAIEYLKSKLDDLNMYGRNGYGVPRRDPNYNPNDEDPICRLVDRIEFYKSMAIIARNGEA